jgi:adenylate cyclase
MAQEIERKFLVQGSFESSSIRKMHFRQGYLPTNKGCTVRIRTEDERAFLTIKGASDAAGISRYEWNHEITLQEANELFLLCTGNFVEKDRYLVPAGTHMYEVDVFHGDNEGLIVAEIELNAEDEAFEKPDWLGQEVTGNRRYYNSHLAVNPYKFW